MANANNKGSQNFKYKIEIFYTNTNINNAEACNSLCVCV